jgi:deoxycytidylate deaminase
LIKEPWQPAIDAAITAAQGSQCLSKRGAAIWGVRGGNYLISTGRNYKPVFALNCTRDAKCKANCRAEAVHAEQDAIISALHQRDQVAGADMLHVKVVDGLVVPSGEPSCVQCSKLIVAAGIIKMWLFHIDGWKSYSASEFHCLSVSGESARQKQKVGC